jgi:hypothetical protein
MHALALLGQPSGSLFDRSGSGPAVVGRLIG